MDIKGLWGHNFSSTSQEELIAVRGTKTWANRGGSWLTGATVTSGADSFMASFIDKVFHVNETDNNFEYNGTYWTANENIADTPIARFVFAHESRLFLFGLTLDNGAPNVLSWPTRVWYSDLPNSGGLTWGLEYGYDLETTAGSAVVTSDTAAFEDKNIKVGDPFFINYSDVGNKRNKPYIVRSIDGHAQITLTENIPNTSTDDIYWVGGNWFDVEVDQGDVANGISSASNEIIFFLKNSVYRYNVSGETLRKIKDAPGTTSPRSPVSWGGYCWWFHPSGVYRTSGGTFEKVSNAIEDIIDGVPDTAAVVGFVDPTRNEIGMYLGDVTLRDGDTIDDCVSVYNLDSTTWEPRSYDRPFKVAANWLKSSVPKVYIGDDDSGVFQLNTGTDFNDSDIPFGVELYPIFPAGEDAIVTFNRIRAYVENGPDIQIFYKLIYKPRGGVENVWDSDETWHALQGSQIGDRVEWYFPTDARASGVKLKIVESGADESFLLEKLSLYYSVPANY